MNRIREAIKERGYALGGVTTMGDTNLIEMMARAGVDFVWVEMQHSCPSPWDSRAISDMLRAAEIANSTLLVRVPEANPALICKVLDTGVRNILVPEISKQEEIDATIRGGRYHIKPDDLGWRSLGSGREAMFTPRNIEVMEKINSEVMLGVMLEKKEAIDGLGKLISLKGLDFVFIGPVDLSISLGIPLQTTHPTFKEYFEKAVSYCKKEGILIGMNVSSAEDAKKRIDEGIKLITVGSDLRIVYSYFKETLKKIKG